MEEKKLISLTDEIVDAIVNISMGKGKMKAMIPGSAAKKIINDEELFKSLKECYINYLSSVTGKIDDRDELRNLSDFRYELEALYNDEEVEETQTTEEEN